MSRRYTYMLMLADDAQVVIRTDRAAMVAGWLAMGGRACIPAECFDSPCSLCLQAGEAPEVQDEPLVPVYAYMGELQDIEVAMRENGSWDGLDTYDPHDYGTYADPGPCTWDPELGRVSHDAVLCPLVQECSA